MLIKRKVLKNLGALDKIDDGKPDFLKRLKISKTADKKPPIKTADKKPPIRTANNIETIIEYLTANTSARAVEISELLGLSDRRTRELLKKMVDDELLETNGSKKNRTYSLRRQNCNK